MVIIWPEPEPRGETSNHNKNKSTNINLTFSKFVKMNYQRNYLDITELNYFLNID